MCPLSLYSTVGLSFVHITVIHPHTSNKQRERMRSHIHIILVPKKKISFVPKYQLCLEEVVCGCQERFTSVYCLFFSFQCHHNTEKSSCLLKKKSKLISSPCDGCTVLYFKIVYTAKYNDPPSVSSNINNNYHQHGLQYLWQRTYCSGQMVRNVTECSMTRSLHWVHCQRHCGICHLKQKT